MPRLPHNFGDRNEWGTLLLDFLRVAHNEDGSLKSDGGTVEVQKQPLPNGDLGRDFNGVGDYLEHPDHDKLSIPTTGKLSWMGWLSPSAMNFANQETWGAVHWIGKGERFGDDGNHEWFGRMYSYSNEENRPHRISAYAVSNEGFRGSGGYSQRTMTPGSWTCFGATYSLDDDAVDFPATNPVIPGIDSGRIRTYRDGKISKEVPLTPYHGEHDLGDTHELDVIVDPQNADAPFRIGSRDGASWFHGRIAKVAIWDKELTAEEVASIYNAMMSEEDYDAAVAATTPIGYWTLEGGAPGLANQITGSGLGDLAAGTELPPGEIIPSERVPTYQFTETGDLLLLGSLAAGKNVDIVGRLTFGDLAVSLYRTAQNALKTQGDFVAQGTIRTYDGDIWAGGDLIGGGSVEVKGAEEGWAIARFENTDPEGTGILVRLNPAAIALGYPYLFWGGVAGDQARFLVRGDGQIRWGPGGATAPDVNLYRSGVDRLETDDQLTVYRLGVDETWGSGVTGVTGSIARMRVYDSTGTAVGVVAIYPNQ